MKIAIIGLGYVGLPLSLQFTRSGAKVLGLDVDPAKVKAIKEGVSYIKHIESKEIRQHVGEGNLEASTDISRVREADAIIICVPTPLNKNREPDTSYLISTGRAIAPHLGVKTAVSGRSQTRWLQARKAEYSKLAVRNGRSSLATRNGSGTRVRAIPHASRNNGSSRPKLVVLESTTYPGTTDSDLREVLESGSGLKAGKGFHLAYSPEREDPGNPQSQVGKIPKVVGGYTPACLKRACELYGRAIESVVPVSSCRVAEAAKLLENIFRSVNIALVNELKVIYEEMGIDIWEVIEAAKTKPFGFMPFYPGPGLGGHCIPIDPFYLTWKAREFSKSTRFIELAGEINTSMPQYVFQRIGEALNLRRKALNGSRILVVGLAYKPDVDDIRESPSFRLMDLLTEHGSAVDYHDPHVPTIPPTREHSSWTGKQSTDLNEETVSQYDCVVISTAHRCIDFRQLAQWTNCIVDTRNAMAKIGVNGDVVMKA